MKIKIMAWICILAMTVGALSGCKQQNDFLPEQSVAGSGSFFEEDTENAKKETESTEQIIENGDGERLPVDLTPRGEDAEQTTVGEKTETNSSSVEGTVNDPILQELADPEDKVYCQATLKDDFEPGTILLRLTEKVSAYNKDWSSEIFSCVEFETVEWKNREEFGRVNNYQQRYVITLKEKTKEATLAAVKQLEQLSYVAFAEPNYYLYAEVDCVESNLIETASVTAVGIQSGRDYDDPYHAQ